MNNQEKNYEELRQKRIREKEIIQNFQKANEKNKICKYSEEQVLEAQKENAKIQINELYDMKIVPISNTILYMMYYIVALIILPINYVLSDVGKIYVTIIVCVLVILVIIIVKIVEKKVKFSVRKERKWVAYFERFALDTMLVNYVLTAASYIIVYLNKLMFWIMYLCMVCIFVIAFVFDILKPLFQKVHNDK